MFISQTAPLNTRNRILNPHQDDFPPIFSAIIVFLVTTGFNTKTKTCYLKIMLLISKLCLWPFYGTLQCLKNCTSPVLNQIWNSCLLNTKQMRNKITRHNQVHNECRYSFRHCRFVDNVLLEHPVNQYRWNYKSSNTHLWLFWQGETNPREKNRTRN